MGCCKGKVRPETLVLPIETKLFASKQKTKWSKSTKRECRAQWGFEPKLILIEPANMGHHEPVY